MAEEDKQKPKDQPEKNVKDTANEWEEAFAHNAT